MPNDGGYWFAAKRYGWGWGLPIAWQGWVATLLWLVLLLVGLFVLRRSPDQPASSIAFVLFMGGVLTLVCYWKGEPPKWRRGDR